LKQNLFTTLGGHELRLLSAIAVLASGMALFGALAGEILEGDTQAFDRKILLSMRHSPSLAPIGPPAVQEAARDTTALGGTLVLTLVTLASAIYLLLDGKRRMALFVLASVSSGLLAATVLKLLFNRPRPELVPHAAYASTSSFPSGHSMMSALTYLTLGALLARSQERKRLKAFAMLLAATLTFLVGLSRIYLGVHWPTDVLAGWSVGVAWTLLCWLLASVLPCAPRQPRA